MKIYTSQVPQFGKELKILDKVVKFDEVGCAEVEEEVGEKIMNYSQWYTVKKIQIEEKAPKKYQVDSEQKDEFIEELNTKLQKITKQIEAGTSKYKLKEVENAEIRKDMGVIVEERNILKEDIDNSKQIHNKEKEILEHKYKLALLEKPELKKICEEMGIPEEKYIKKQKREVLIDLIIKEAE